MSNESIEFGVTRLSIVPVRLEPSHRSEQVTQLLFGDHYEVLSSAQDGKWLHIRIYFDQYEGWIDVAQHHPISKEYFEYINRADFKITTDLTTSILYNKNPLMIVMGSVIPISTSELFKMEEQFAFNGEAKSIGLKREAEYVKNAALKYLNAPYQWGGKSPFGIDCSGFAQMVFKINGYKLHRDAAYQAKQGKVVKWSDVRICDLAFFKNSEGKIVHVGIVLPDRKIIHASGKVRVDQLTEDGIVTLESKVLTHSLAFIKRILTE